MRVAREKNRWQTSLNESSTLQFPRETDRLYTVVDLSPPPSSDQVADTAKRSPTVASTKLMQTPMSPSIYSRNTDGFSILPNDSVMSFGGLYEPERTQLGGSAVILTSQSVRSYVIGTPSPNRRESARSSHDWKAWLSHEVSGIEAAGQEDITIHEQYATPPAKHKRAISQTTRSPQTGVDDTTVVVRESFDSYTPRVVSGNSPAPATDLQVPGLSACELALNRVENVPRCDATGLEALKKPPSEQYTIEAGPLPASISTPVTHRDRPESTPSSSCTNAQPPLGTPTFARMNDRFPFLDIGSRSSSNSSCSQLSKSPASSVKSSSKNTKAPSRVQTSLSAIPVPVTRSNSAKALGAIANRAESTHKSKENVTQSSNTGLGRPNVSSFGPSQRPKSLQPLSLAALNSNLVNSGNMAHSPGNVADERRLKRAPSLAETAIARPSLRGTIRPLSHEKLSQRPRSASSLRHTPPARPESKLRRSALKSQASPSVFASMQSPMKSEGGSGDVMDDANQREGSVTPGQRMAERFLKERKSVTVLERGVRESTCKLVREDTPAFL